VLKSIQQGKKVGIVDLTRGEMGSRGSGELRLIEAQKASEILGLSARENLMLDDCFFQQDRESIMAIINVIRKYKPEIVLTNAPTDRHPDHGRASKLVRDACFYSGLRKIEDGQEAWRTKSVYMFNQDYYNKPDFVVDVTAFWDKKVEALMAFSSQFFDPNSSEPVTPISGKEFFEFIRSRSMDFGRPAGYLLAEGFITDRAPGVDDLFHLH
jgi:bacillithiol biosynthesis deacetylase BshB1